MTAPASYQGVPVPEAIAAAWKTWAGAEWRKQAHWSKNRLNAPDQRFSVVPPAGMCTVHLEMRRGYRDMHFDDRSGNRWPGGAGSPFTIIDRDLGRELAWRRSEWDEKASEQMQLIETMCLTGRSAQCGGERSCTRCSLHRATAEWLAWIDSPLPPGHVRAQRREHRCMCETFGEWQPADG
jgi:hypothetical protein